MSKYKARKVYVYASGHKSNRKDETSRFGDVVAVFDSEREYNRWCELLWLLKAGKISCLKRQVRYDLIPSQRVDGKVVERPCYYVADFEYIKDGKLVVEDVKGVRTPDYVIKRKLMLWHLGIQIQEV